MKTKLFSMVGLSLLFLMIGSASAQVMLPEVKITGARNVPAKVDEAFKSTFKNGEDPVWYNANKNFLVRFINNDMNNSALYKKNGNMIYNISYGFEKDLPDDVSELIKRKYEGYQVIVAFNVKQDERNVWVVNLENEKANVTARVEDGVLNEAARSRKKMQ